MTQLKQLPTFSQDEELIAFMETHDGFELIDAGLAEIVPSAFYRKNPIIVDAETLQLLDELIVAGICENVQDAVTKAIHSYVVAVLPQRYTLTKTHQEQTVLAL